MLWGPVHPQSASQAHPTPSPSPGNPTPLQPSPCWVPTHLGQELLLVCLHPKAGYAGVSQAAAVRHLLHPRDLRHRLELWLRGWGLLGGSRPRCPFSIPHHGRWDLHFILLVCRRWRRASMGPPQRSPHLALSPHPISFGKFCPGWKTPSGCHAVGYS